MPIVRLRAYSGRREAMGMVRLVGGLLGALLVVAVILAVVGLAAAFWPVTIVVCLVGGGWALRKGVRGIRALRHL